MTPLYKRMKKAQNVVPWSDLDYRVWEQTPHVIDVQFDCYTDEEFMAEWCRINLGDESDLKNYKRGKWRRARSVLFGWTMFGFDTEEHMLDFIQQWPENAIRPWESNS